jgi:hypothetical protein
VALATSKVPAGALMSDQHAMRVQLQELSESLKDVQEELREPNFKTTTGLGTLPVQVDCRRIDTHAEAPVPSNVPFLSHSGIPSLTTLHCRMRAWIGRASPCKARCQLEGR